MKYEIIKPISKFEILKEYFKGPNCSEFEREYMEFDKMFIEVKVFNTFPDVLIWRIIEAGKDKWIEWLTEHGFIKQRELTEAELRTAWYDNSDRCPYCESGAVSSPDYEEDAFLTGEVEVYYSCGRCREEWKEWWSCDSVDFDV